MKKKTPWRQPPSREKGMDQWVAHGTAPTAPKEKPARLTIDLPPELHSRFKAACAIHKTRMIDQVRAFIEEWTKKHS